MRLKIDGAARKAKKESTGQYGKSLSTMYNANTNRADTQNRKDAINTLIQQMYQKGNTISLGMVRYLGGYYYSYIIISWGTNSLNITILEYSMHVPETYIWGQNNNGEISIMQKFTAD